MNDKHEKPDLFEQWESLPSDIQDLISAYNERLEGDENGYEVCKSFLKTMNSKGYTFEYGLDGVPFNLQKLPRNNRKWETDSSFTP